ncbi:MAG: YaeQ family protein [Rhodocyclaceae bacterium]|nr:YaeQ family protein [Rhodocyclaceae bacterium]
MALKSTVFKASLGVADLDRPHYGDYNLTLARHPSETDERMMMRLLAFALFADEHLEFGRGLSAEDEPALWLRDYSGEIRLWIEVGLPDERAIRKAAGRARAVVVLAYGGRTVDLWWAKEGGAMSRLDKLCVLALDAGQSAALTALAQRNMQLQCTIQDGQVWLTDGVQTVPIEPRRLAGGCQPCRRPSA